MHKMRKEGELMPPTEEQSNKTVMELASKCNEIIDSMKDFNMVAKYRVISNLYHSFLRASDEAGYAFVEVERNGGKL